MGSIGDDTEAQLSMMMRAYLALRKIDPEHGLLKLVKPHEDEGGFDFNSELWEVFGSCSDGVPAIHAWAEYTFALQCVVQQAKPQGYTQQHQVEAFQKYIGWEASRQPA